VDLSLFVAWAANKRRGPLFFSTSLFPPLSNMARVYSFLRLTKLSLGANFLLFTSFFNIPGTSGGRSKATSDSCVFMDIYSPEHCPLDNQSRALLSAAPSRWRPPCSSSKWTAACTACSQCALKLIFGSFFFFVSGLRLCEKPLSSPNTIPLSSVTRLSRRRHFFLPPSL